LIAWHGDMDLVPHLADLFTLPNIDCRVTLLPARAVETSTNRKALTRDIEDEIRRAHDRALRSRAL